MLGEYAQDMQDSPYILESLIENWDEEPSAEVIRCNYLVIYLCMLKLVPKHYPLGGFSLELFLLVSYILIPDVVIYFNNKSIFCKCDLGWCWYYRSCFNSLKE